MWQRGEITVMKNLPSFVPRTLVQQYARSEVRVQRRTLALLWWVLEQWWGVLNAAWSGAATLWLWDSDINTRSSDWCVCYC